MAPLVKILLGALVKEGVKRAAPKVIDKVTRRAAPKPPKQTPRKEQPMQAAILGALRHILQLGAGALVAKGVIDAGAVELVIGAGMSAATLGWYLLERKLVTKA